MATTTRPTVIAIPGPQGPQGEPGLAGPQGPKGVQGIQGVPGAIQSVSGSGAIVSSGGVDPTLSLDNTLVDHGLLSGLADDDHPQYAFRALTRPWHEPIGSPSRGSTSPGQGPPIAIFGTLATLVFTPGDTADRIYRTVKIQPSYSDTPAFHIHWTKSTDVAQTGRAVRWRISYVVFDGSSNDALVAPTVAEVEDTYDATDTTARVVYRTASVAAVGFVASYYIAFMIEAITPTGAALTADPALVSADVTYNVFANE